MAEQLSWDEWRAKAKKEYKKGVYTATDMVKDWGYPEGVSPSEFRMIFRSGEPGKKNRQAINVSKAKSNKGRSTAETYSTDLAGAERRSQDKQFRKVLDEASLFSLTDKELATYIEHDVALDVTDVVDNPDASGDPTNRSLQPVTKGINKTEAEKFLKDKGLKEQFVILQDEQTGGFRVVSTDTANTFQFPSEQGRPFSSMAELKEVVDDPDSLKPSSLLNDLNLTPAQRGQLSRAQSLEAKDALISKFKSMPTKTQLAMAGIASASFLGTGVSAAETAIRGKETVESFKAGKLAEGAMNLLQTTLSGASTVADLIPGFGELVSTPADVANVAIDELRKPKAQQMKQGKGYVPMKDR
jgi:hypothetical protein